MENRRGFHNPASQGHDHNRGGSSGGAPPHGGPHRHMAEPTNHAGHTHEMARTHEHNARVEATRNLHAGHGQHDHERILHDTHKLHQGHEPVSQSKHGAEHHVREGGEE